MKKFLLIGLAFFATAGLSIGQDTLLTFDAVTDPLIEPFDLAFPTNETTEFFIANPDGEGNVGKIEKTMETRAAVLSDAERTTASLRLVGYVWRDCPEYTAGRDVAQPNPSSELDETLWARRGTAKWLDTALPFRYNS